MKTQKNLDFRNCNLRKNLDLRKFFSPNVRFKKVKTLTFDIFRELFANL